MTSNTRRNQRQPSVTGRDDYIVLMALAYAMRTIQSLPWDRQDWANMKDMERLLLYRTRDFRFFLNKAEARIGGRNWPNVGALHQHLERPT